MTSPSLRPGDIVRIRDERWRVARVDAYPDVAILGVRGCDRANAGCEARFLLPFEPVQRHPHLETVRIVRPGRWRHMARGALAGATTSWTALRAAPRADIAILPFQLEPAIAVVGGTASRVLIADEVGLGKTIQAGLIAAELLQRLPDAHILVVVPAGLRDQWREELLARFAIEPFAADAASLAGFGRGGGATPWLSRPVVITSIDFVKRPETLRGLETIVWDLLIFDEAHALGARSDRSEAAARLARRARTVVMLTATPHSGDDEPFTRLCGLGDLDEGFPLLAFRRTRRDSGLATSRRTTVLRVRTTPAESRLHTALEAYVRAIWRQHGSASSDARLVAMVLARRGSSSAGSLATSLERRLALLSGHSRDPQLILPLEAGDEAPELALGAPGLYDAHDECRQLATLLSLARAAEDHESKLRAVRRLLERTSEPAIVFTEYRDTLACLERALAGERTTILHGGLSAAERRDVVRTFTGAGTRVLLATDAASEGLNLHHHCRLVINLEIPWTPRRLEQRVGRVERIGQRRRVHDIRLVAAGTLEETTLAVLTRRAERARDVLEHLRGQSAERDVGAIVLGRETAVDRTGPPTDGVFTLEGGREAAGEAARIETARQLGFTGPEGDQPFACAMSAPGMPARAFWLYRLAFDDRDDVPLWDIVMAFGSGATLPRSPAPHDVRRFVDLARPSLDGAARLNAELEVSRLRDAVARQTLRAIARERAIVDSARREGARLAAPLVQRSLFDRRAERAAADQAAALAELVARCQARLDGLERQLDVKVSREQLIFALVRTT